MDMDTTDKPREPAFRDIQKNKYHTYLPARIMLESKRDNPTRLSLSLPSPTPRPRSLLRFLSFVYLVFAISRFRYSTGKYPSHHSFCV